MVQLIIGLFLFVLALWILAKIAKVVWVVFLGVLGLLAVWVFGPSALVGAVFAFACQKIKLQKLGIFFVCAIGMGLPFWVAYTYGLDSLDLLNFEAGKFLVFIPLFALAAPAFGKIERAEVLSVRIDFFSSRKNLCINLICIACALALTSAIKWNPVIEGLSLFELSYLVESYQNWFEIGFWATAIFMLLIVIVTAMGIENAAKVADRLISDINNESRSKIYASYLSQQEFLSQEEAPQVFDAVLAKYILNGKIHELNLKDDAYLFDKEIFEQSSKKIKKMCEDEIRITKDKIADILEKHLSLPASAAQYYAEFHLDFGGYYCFRDGQYFSSYKNTSHLNVCCSCGTTEIRETTARLQNWYCSEICKDTESKCIDLKRQPDVDFLSNCATAGVVMMAGAQQWNENHKIFAAGGQGHGFAAEKANDMIDKLQGKSAEVVGGNNAKDGADRLVNGRLIQTKYCSTGARSVGSAFDGQNGNYRYYDGDRPMVLEVPKDQYDQAVKTMQQKISDGKVPGVTNPEEAKNLILKGGVTYDQAKNIAQFGTVESLTFDLAEGAVVGAMAGGISFCITASVYYYQTQNKEEALKSAMVQAGSTFTKTTIIFIGTQQLHRLASVQNALANIDVNNLSSSLKTTLKNGLGVESVEGVNKALRGTVVTTAVLIAVTSGPDLIKMVRGRISATQFLKNLAVVTSSAVGGIIGSIAGGALLSPFGPAAMVVGRIGGGIIGGSALGYVTKYIGDKLAEDDKVKMLEIIIVQVEYLAKIFMLTDAEVQNLNSNLNVLITQKMLESLYANKDNRIALANFFIKPVVVGIIRQRPLFEVIEGELESASLKLAA
ncbi:MAG TPA: hypothetical protein PK002_07160 [Cellvibrio sp.]|nr:hypothetical protein [Cellvibrio sp.]